MYHVVNGKVYACPDDIDDMEEYKKWVKKAYGNLRGVKFTFARNRHDALFNVSIKN